MSVAQPDKRYQFDKPAGGHSPDVNLKTTMDAAARQLKVGEGAFTVIRGGHFRHPNLDRNQALSVIQESLKAVPVASGVVVRDATGAKVFHAVRMATNPYLNPFRDVSSFAAERIDAGVDYYGHGPVYALGNAIIINVGTPSGTPSTFGHDMAIYQLLDGPAKGKFVYFAEQYLTEAGLSKGQHVDSATVLYNMTGFIEIGWSDGHGSMAWDLDDTIEGQRTVWGQNFSDLLVTTDCLAGLTLGRDLTMTLPSDWPMAA